MRTNRLHAGRMVVVTGLVLVAGIVVGAPRAEAKGTMLDPVQDRYEPGETATMIGYTSQLPGSPDPRDPAVTDQFQGYLVTEAEWMAPQPEHDGDGFLPMGLPLGRPEVLDTRRTDFPPVRVSLTFPIPGDVEPGVYYVIFAEPTGSTLLGDMTGGMVHIGVDPTYTIARSWPLDEPAIAELADDARVWDINSGETVTAAQIRAGDIPPPTTWVEPPPDEPTPSPDARSGAGPDEGAAAAASDPDGGRSVPGWVPWLAVGALVGVGAVATRAVHRTSRSVEIASAQHGGA